MAIVKKSGVEESPVLGLGLLPISNILELVIYNS